MLEAETVCSKIGIMTTGGKFKCFGTAEHIKQKYGDGFEIELKLKPHISAKRTKDLLVKLGLEAMKREYTIFYLLHHCLKGGFIKDDDFDTVRQDMARMMCSSELGDRLQMENKMTCPAFV
jgi:hypothetical protein